MSNEKLNKIKYDVIIIGGGASGMMAGIIAARSKSNIGDKKKVLIIEKNSELGKKLKITGGGRCNILNAEYEVDKLLTNYKDAKKYLYTPFSKFGVLDTVKFFEEIGIKIKIEDPTSHKASKGQAGKRAFPMSEKALDVYNAMYDELTKLGVEIKLNTKISKFILKENKVEHVVVHHTEHGFEEEKLYADKFILSTGGMSHKETGSDGFGFELLAKMGIKIDTFNPSLVPVSVSNSWVKSLTGKSIEDIKLSFYVDGIKKKVIKLNIETKNRILFTHFGLSGPTMLNLSKTIKDWLSEGEVTLKIDLFPFMDESMLDKFLLDIFDNNKNKIFKNILNEIYSGNILESAFRDKEFLSHYASESKGATTGLINEEVNSISKANRRKLVNILKNLEINITGLMGYDKAIIADGGVNLNEVNFEDFSLKKIKNLHVTGDLLNITRPSGGYSLQLCWTTGYIAGNS